MSSPAHDLLKRVFGYDDFRGPQQAIIEHVAAGNDALVLMPTGGGKSLCYQVPSLLREGTGNEIASYNLLNAVSELIGSPRTPYMQFLTDFGLASPIYNVRMLVPLNEQLEAFVNGQRMISYDRIVGKNYSVK